MVINSYRNFELIVNRDSTNPQNLSVQVLNSPAGNQPKPELTSIPSSLQQNLRWLEERKVNSDDIVELGEMLATLLFPVEVRELFIRSLDMLASQQGLRLQLRLDSSLSSIPWEYLYLKRDVGEKDSSGFLALNPRISIARFEALGLPGEFDKTPKTRRLLVALASPTDQDPLNLDQESDSILNALKGVPGIELELLKDANIQALNDKMMTGADIFHFAGHGIFKLNPGTKTGQGALVLVGEDGKSALMPADQVAMNLRGRGVQLVILGACHTGRRDEQNVWSGVVAALMRVGIPAAVAMQYKVWDDSAIAFGRSFYKALAAGLPLDQAVSSGRLAVFNLCHPLRNDSEQGKFWRDWGVPVLYLRAEEEFFLPSVVDAEQRDSLLASLPIEDPQNSSSTQMNPAPSVTLHSAQGTVLNPTGPVHQHFGDKRTVKTGGGDYAEGNFYKSSASVNGDIIKVGNISNSQGIAIGRGASAVVRIVNRLQESTDPEQQKLSNLLMQLQSTIQQPTSGLDEKSQKKALKHLETIAKFGSDLQNTELGDAAETALDALSTILNNGSVGLINLNQVLEEIRETLEL